MSCGRMPEMLPMMSDEGYTSSGSSSPCDSQDDFNKAVRSALKYNYKQEVKKAKPWMFVYMIIYLIFVIWAVMLAMKVPAGNERTEHLVFAIVFAPVYVLASYLGMLGENSMAGFGMCGMKQY